VIAVDLNKRVPEDTLGRIYKSSGLNLLD